MLKRWIPLAALASIAACASTPGAPTDPAGGTGNLALLNAMSSSDAASLTLDGVAVTLPPIGMSGTATVDAGAHTLQAHSSVGTVITSTTFTMLAGSHRTAVISGAIGHNVLLVNPPDTASAPVLDATKLRLVNSAPDSPQFDAYVFEVGQAADSAARFVAPFTFGVGSDVRFPGYAVRPAGNYLIWLKAAGTDNVVLQAGPIALAAGTVYSFVLSENTDGSLQFRTVKEQ